MFGSALEALLGFTISPLEALELFISFAKRILQFGDLLFLFLKIGRMLLSALLFLSCETKELVRIRKWFGRKIVRMVYGSDESLEGRRKNLPSRSLTCCTSLLNCSLRLSRSFLSSVFSFLCS